MGSIIGGHNPVSEPGPVVGAIAFLAAIGVGVLFLIGWFAPDNQGGNRSVAQVIHKKEQEKQNSNSELKPLELTIDCTASGISCTFVDPIKTRTTYRMIGEGGVLVSEANPFFSVGLSVAWPSGNKTAHLLVSFESMTLPLNVKVVGFASATISESNGAPVQMGLPALLAPGKKHRILIQAICP